LLDLQEAAVKNADDTAMVMSWMNANDAVMLAVEWSNHLPEELRNTLPLRCALAESYAILRDWEKLEPLVTGAQIRGTEFTDIAAALKRAKANEKKGSNQYSWGRHEYRRLAFCAALALAARDQEYARVEWSLATKAAGTRLDARIALAQYAMKYGWGDAKPLLWQVAEGPLEQDWALRILYHDYMEEQYTQGLQSVAKRWYELYPRNAAIRNNYAAYNLLLGSRIPESVEIMKALYKEEPGNADYATTYALGLYLQGQMDEAVRVVRALPEEQTRDPHIAAYCGVVLSGAGFGAEASPYLTLAKSARLLPEEDALLKKALATVGS
jgi:hypothetical protein